MFRFIAVVLALALCGCSSSKDESTKQQAAGEKQQAAAERTEPDVIAVQHILIAFQGTLPGKPVDRTRDEAAELAADVFRRAQAGEDFDALVRKYTDDSAPGIYKMANNGVSTRPGERVFKRGNMVKSFGDVGFSLEVGEIGMAEYHATNSQFGWHIIKRIE